MIDHNGITNAINEALKEKGKKKFKQTVDLSINFKNIDFKKPENRINMDIVLPEGRGKEIEIVIFTDNPQTQLEAKKANLKVYGASEIEKLAEEPKKLKKIAASAEFLADPKLMATVGKHLGKVLGVTNKLPRPLSGPLTPAVATAKKRVRLSTKGKYLPVIHCPVGSEDMDPNKIAQNIEVVFEKLKTKVSEQNIKSAYVKLTMGKPVKI